MFILIDKPKGITSHDVVDRLRIITGEKRIGHAGTLDPNASGLLIIGIGRESTKSLGNLLKGNKTYQAEIVFGEEKDTDDKVGKIIKRFTVSRYPTSLRIKNTLKSFLGKHLQTPPIFSAIKIKGRKSYEIARKGGTLDLPPRKIVIHSIKLIKYKYPILEIETEVSGGTYIRSLARDLGRKLGCGGYLKNLKRTQVGDYKIADSTELKKLNRDNWKNFAISLLKK